MSGSKRRKRRPGAPAPRPAPTKPTRAATPPRSERPSIFGGLFRGAAVPSPLPTIRTCLARGFVAAASQPAILIPALLLVPGLWFVLVAAGLQGPPGRMAGFLAIPPISTGFDYSNLTDLLGQQVGLLAALGSIPARALLVALLTGMFAEALERGTVSVDGLRRGIRAWPVTTFTTVLGLGMLMVGNLIFGLLGGGLNLLASILTPVAALFFFVYAPAAAVRERRGIVETVRRSARAGMIPGSRHFMLSMLYVFVVFLSLPMTALVAPQTAMITVNPAPGGWVAALVVGFVHLGFTGAFVFRWIAAEPLVPEQPVRRR